MKILFYISTIRGGGAARVMTIIANGLAEKGFDVSFVTNFPADHEYDLKSEIRRYSLEAVENTGNKLTRNHTRIKKLRRILKNENPDVAVSFMGENNFRLLMAAAFMKVKTIVSLRNDPAKVYPTKLSRLFADLLYKRADKAVFQTNEARDFFSSKVQERSKIILNPVDKKFFYKSMEIGDYYVAAGRLSKQKNYPMMLNAFAEVLKVNPGERLRIYGEGGLKDELSDLTKELGIQDSVEFMGFSTDMPEALKHAKALVMTSDYEGLPNAVLEALASSVPVISTDCPCGGPRMVIENGINGYLVPVGDIGSLAKVWCGLSPEQILTMKDEAYKIACKFEPDSILQEWIDIILSVKGKDQIT